MQTHPSAMSHTYEEEFACDRERTYGANTIDDDEAELLDAVEGLDPDKVEAEFEHWFSSIRAETKEIDAALLRGEEVTLPDGEKLRLAPHIRRIYTDPLLCGDGVKEPVLLARLAQELGAEFLAGSAISQSPWLIGFEHEGPWLPTGLWKRGKPLSELERARYSEALAPGFINEKVKPMRQERPVGTDEAQRRQWAESADLRSGTVLEACEPPGEEEIATIMFPLLQKWSEELQQHTKCRTIVHEVERNTKYTRVGEHASLPSVAQLTQAVSYCATGARDAPVMQMRRDVAADIDYEKITKMRQLVRSPHRRLPKRRKRRGWIPRLAKVDCSNAFFQLPARRPQHNRCKMWNPTLQPPGWSHFRSNSLTMGNIRSILSWMTVSVFLGRLFRRFGIPLWVYIDDLIAILSGGNVRRLREFIVKTVRRLGFGADDKKLERHHEEAGKVVTNSVVTDGGLPVLGIEFLVLEEESRPARMEIFAPEAKVAGVIHSAAMAAEAAVDGSLSLTQLQTLHGEMCFCFFARVHKATMAHFGAISSWLDERRFAELLPKRSAVAALAHSLRRIADERVVAYSRLSIACHEDEVPRGRWHLYTDAAAPEGKVFMGGVCIDPQNNRRAFRIELPQRKLPLALRNATIYVCELLATYLAIEYFQLRDVEAVVHVDNIGGLYSMVKGHAACPIGAAIAADISAGLVGRGVAAFFAYVSSRRNVADATTRMMLFQELIDFVGADPVLLEANWIAEVTEKLCADTTSAVEISRAFSIFNSDRQLRIVEIGKRLTLKRLLWKKYAGHLPSEQGERNARQASRRGDAAPVRRSG